MDARDEPPRPPGPARWRQKKAEYKKVKAAEQLIRRMGMTRARLEGELPDFTPARKKVVSELQKLAARTPTRSTSRPTLIAKGKLSPGTCERR